MIGWDMTLLTKGINGSVFSEAVLDTRRGGPKGLAYEAIQEGDIGAVRMLISKGYCVWGGDLSIAIRAGQLQMLDYLTSIFPFSLDVLADISDLCMDWDDVTRTYPWTPNKNYKKAKSVLPHIERVWPFENGKTVYLGPDRVLFFEKEAQVHELTWKQLYDVQRWRCLEAYKYSWSSYQLTPKYHFVPKEAN